MGTSSTQPLRPLTSGQWLNDDEPEEIVLDDDMASRQHLTAAHQDAQLDRVETLLQETAKSAVPHQSVLWFFPLLQDGAVKLAVVAAMFIIFNTFSMGVQEHTRQLAMLRAVGMTPGRMIATLLSESLTIALVGWIAGMLIGLRVLEKSLQPSTQSGLDISLSLNFTRLWLLGAATAFGSVIIATILPAYLASRKRPLDGMSASPLLNSQSAPWWLTVLGVAMVALNPLAAYTPVFPDPMRSHVIMPISFVTALAGFVMLTPILLKLTEPLFVQIAARLLVLNPRLLQRHLSSNLWRTVGCVSALMVGLVYTWSCRSGANRWRFPS